MKVLDITTLFPSQAQPSLGTFVFRRAYELSSLCELQIVVGVGLFPVAKYLPRYRHRRSTEARGQCGNASVRYLRFLSVPRFLKRLDASAFARSIISEIHRGGLQIPDVVTAELIYPDGEAARLVAAHLGVPYFVTCRGHDLNDFVGTGGWQDRAASRVLTQATAVTPVAHALAKVAAKIAPTQRRIETVENGVDETVFGRVARADARKALGIDENKKLVISVGHLVERKGHHIVTEAVSHLRKRDGREIDLAIIGGASEEGNFERDIRARLDAVDGASWTRLVGALPQQEVATWMTAADLLVLASSKEGRPNVVLESLACGTPVVATRVWGTPELISESYLGELCERNVQSIAQTIDHSLNECYQSERIKEYARQFSWQRSAQRLLDIYSGQQTND